jgi:Icc-related predicted phosphoesterase
MGNDDRRVHEPALRAGDAEGLWMYVHDRCVELGEVDLYGYSFVPPTPFRLKDWERYDVSRYTDPGCIPPEDGSTSVELDVRDRMHRTIQEDLETLTAGRDLARAVMLFHSPPYDTALDRAALDGVKVDHAPLDVHVGSIAIRNLILRRQPLVTLHGHIHESARLTGAFMQQLGSTVCLSAAHDGPELAVVCFDIADPAAARRGLF